MNLGSIFGDGRAFIEPTVINGRVYMAYGDPATFSTGPGVPEGPDWYIGAFF